MSDRRGDAGGSRQEAGGSRQEAGGRKQQTGNKKQEREDGRYSRIIFSCRRDDNQILQKILSHSSFEVSLHFSKRRSSE
jgi:hypothetical protein